MSGDEYDLQWVTNRKECDSLLNEIIEISRQLKFDAEIAVPVPQEYLTNIIKLTGEAFSFLNGRKWGYHVVTALTLRESMGFTELTSYIEGVSNRALSTRLKEGVELGIVQRTVFSGPPMRTRYSLTPKGRMVATLLTPLAYYMKRELGYLEPHHLPQMGYSGHEDSE